MCVCVCGQRVKGQQATVNSCLGQFQELQQYLTSYTALHVPVVRSNLSEVTAAVDQLHEHLLKCIEVAMTSDAAGRFLKAATPNESCAHTALHSRHCIPIEGRSHTLAARYRRTSTVVGAQGKHAARINFIPIKMDFPGIGQG